MEYANLYRSISNFLMPIVTSITGFFFSYKWLKGFLNKDTACIIEAYLISRSISHLILIGFNSHSVWTPCQVRCP